MESAPERICETMRPRPSFISCSAESSSAASSRPSETICEVRSPEATRRATDTESRNGPTMLRVIVQATSTASRSATTSTP